MEMEQILFIVIAIALTILSMYLKSKKQKQSSLQNNEKTYYDFPPPEELYYPTDSAVFFEQNRVQNSQQNVNIYPKISKKRKKTPVVEADNLPQKNPENFLQDTDLYTETILLKDFEGTELQKAFLYGEIFKNAKN